MSEHEHELDIDEKHPGPDEKLGYLAPLVGSFSLGAQKGQAAFVWRHYDAHHGHSHFHVDWHNDEMEFVGGVINNKYWCYRVKAGRQGPAYIAFSKEIVTDRNEPLHDEGYRIVYIDHHNHVHLWSWDAKRFEGHKEGHH